MQGVKEGRRGLASIEDSVNGSLQGLKDYVKKSKEGLIIVANNSIDNTRTSKITITKKQKVEEKQLYGYFKRQIGEISLEETWTCNKHKSML